MGSAFNPHILVEKLSKLNSSQQSIETLSHWCIFHMNKAKQVVETWDKQFHCAPREQRLAFLYLANDILQNSRRKGAEFVAEFWKVLPDSLRDVIQNGDEFGKNAALRLISIWEERKVFGSRGQILKEEFVKRQLDNDSRNSKHAESKLRSPGGNALGNSLDKLVSGYQAVYSSQMDEDAIFNRCRNAISFIEKVDKDVEGEYGLGHVKNSITDELKGQNVILRDCIEQLAVVESSRANLVSLLREALQDQVYKLEQVRDQLQTAQTRSEQADTICRQLHLSTNGTEQVLTDQTVNTIPSNQTPQDYTLGPREQPSSATYTKQSPLFPEKPDDPKATAAAVVAKLAASTSSAQMLTFVLSSLASEGIIGSNNIKDPSDNYRSEKRTKIEGEHPSYVSQVSQALVNSQELTSDEKPPPPSSPPPLPPPLPPMQPYPVPQYMQTAMLMPYGYNNVGQQPQIAQPGYSPVAPSNISGFAPPSNSYCYVPESGFYGQPSSLPMAPMSHQ